MTRRAPVECVPFRQRKTDGLLSIFFIVLTWLCGVLLHRPVSIGHCQFLYNVGVCFGHVFRFAGIATQAVELPSAAVEVAEQFPPPVPLDQIGQNFRSIITLAVRGPAEKVRCRPRRLRGAWLQVDGLGENGCL